MAQSVRRLQEENRWLRGELQITAKRWGPERLAGHTTSCIRSSLCSPAAAEYLLELSVNHLLFTGTKGKYVSTQTNLWKGAAGTVAAHTFLPKCASAVVNDLRFRVAEANDAAEIPDKADIFLVVP